MSLMRLAEAKASSNTNMKCKIGSRDVFLLSVHLVHSYRTRLPISIALQSSVKAPEIVLLLL